MILKDYIKINQNFQILQKTKIYISCKKKNTIILNDYIKDTKKLKMNKHKFLEWFIKLKPKQEVKIPFKYIVTHPKEMSIMSSY